jgi:uncharacterized membrane protein YfcA
MLSAANLIVIGTIGVLLGTFSGTTILRRIPEALFHRAVGIVILVLGCFMLARAVGGQ